MRYSSIFVFTVVILCVRGTLVRKCMLAAHKLGMTKGDWAFLDVELVQVNKIHAKNKYVIYVVRYLKGYL
jgi:hypothetical protein